MTPSGADVDVALVREAIDFLRGVGRVALADAVEALLGAHERGRS